MATDFELELVLPEESIRIGESVLMEAHALLNRIENSLSEFIENSPVYRLNRASTEEWIEFDEFFEEVLTLSRTYFDQSGGCFTPFAKSPFVGSFSDLEIDHPGARLRKKRTDLQIGFGAIGKGYALDRVAALLDREGFMDYRLGAGGSSWIFRGFGVDGLPWDIGWAWMRDGDGDGDWCGQHYRLPGGRPIAVGVSGTAEKGQHFFSGGQALESSIRSAFSAGRSAAESDAYSTALMVGASREGDTFLAKLPGHGIHALCLAYVDLDERMFYNQSFDTKFLRGRRLPE